MFHILLFTAQLPAVQWNTGGVTMLPLMNHSDLIESRGDALSLLDGGVTRPSHRSEKQERAEVEREEVQRSGGHNNI